MAYSWEDAWQLEHADETHDLLGDSPEDYNPAEHQEDARQKSHKPYDSYTDIPADYYPAGVQENEKQKSYKPYDPFFDLPAEYYPADDREKATKPSSLGNGQLLEVRISGVFRDDLCMSPISMVDNEAAEETKLVGDDDLEEHWKRLRDSLRAANESLRSLMASLNDSLSELTVINGSWKEEENLEEAEKLLLDKINLLNIGFSPRADDISHRTAQLKRDHDQSEQAQ